ncbi:MAG: 7-cyano-7-deazaguanine synthase QueC [Planctomycetota bacterium]|jgi:7-cyano-7-deazaguanine synthase
MSSGEQAVILLSGGMDSAVVLAEARAQDRTCIALSFDYAQRHRVELDAARRVAAHLGAHEHVVLSLDMRPLGASALTAPIDVPKDRDIEHADDIPVTYVPARNLVFLSCAVALSEARQAREVWIGVNAIDYSGYPDCRPEFIDAFANAARLATRVGVEGHPVEICAPLSEMSKGDIVRRGIELGIDFSLTHSCYDPVGDQPCNHCDACLLRARGFEEAGHDPC